MEKLKNKNKLLFLIYLVSLIILNEQPCLASSNYFQFSDNENYYKNILRKVFISVFELYVQKRDILKIKNLLEENEEKLNPKLLSYLKSYTLEAKPRAYTYPINCYNQYLETFEMYNSELLEIIDIFIQYGKKIKYGEKICKDDIEKYLFTGLVEIDNLEQLIKRSGITDHKNFKSKLAVGLEKKLEKSELELLPFKQGIKSFSNNFFVDHDFIMYNEEVLKNYKSTIEYLKK